MTGATLTVVNTVPHMGKTLIYFSVTLDATADASFADYTTVDWISAVDVDTLAPEDATVYTAAGDIRFTNGDNVIKGVALVNL